MESFDFRKKWLCFVFYFCQLVFVPHFVLQFVDFERNVIDFLNVLQMSWYLNYEIILYKKLGYIFLSSVSWKKLAISTNDSLIDDLNYYVDSLQATIALWCNTEFVNDRYQVQSWVKNGTFVISKDK